MGEHIHHHRKDLKNKKLELTMSKTLNLHTAESEFSNFMIENVGEIETEFENTSACTSGAQIGSYHEKNWTSKIL